MRGALVVGICFGIGWLVYSPRVSACEACRWSASPAVHTVGPLPTTMGPNFSLDVPVLNSFPGAHAKIYLDFDGDFTPQWQGHTPGHTPAYSIDSDTSTFSQQELINIRQIWSRVAEKFSPFKINVTTVDPGNRNEWETVHVVIGGNGTWLGFSAGGVAAVGGFYSPANSNTVFVFSGNLLNGDPKRVSEASAHESGHSFGLQHQSLYDANGNLLNEYNPGNPFRAPIMGNSYNSVRGLWWRGSASLPQVIQDDLDILSAPLLQFGYREDDHADTFAGATPLLVNGNSVSGSGIISRMPDVDYFSFETLSGDVSFTVGVAEFGPMLDATLSLFDSGGALLMRSATFSLSEFISTTLPAGTYYLAVSSAKNYGDLGQYSLNGTIVPVPEPIGAVMALSWMLFASGRSLRFHRKLLRDRHDA